MIANQLQPLANHLWQSTVFAAAAGFLTLTLRNNRAPSRYWLWFAASIKFLIPFSILVEAGNHFGGNVPRAIPPSGVSSVIDFGMTIPLQLSPAAQSTSANLISIMLCAVWATGFVTLACSWWLRWRRIRTALRTATPLDLPIPAKVMTSSAIPEPGVFGVRHPVLLLPTGIADRLTPPQLEAILRHELCHIRRRDNLTAAIHMAVEAIFWFHPLVWWLGSRLIEERERACDEEVLRGGVEPEVYAEGILKICELCMESRLPCVAGVTGANLKKRIEAIMTNRLTLKLNLPRKAILTAAGILALSIPVVVGFLRPPIILAQARVAVPPARIATYLNAIGAVTAASVLVKPRIDGQLTSLNFEDGDMVQAGQLLASIDASPYQVQLDQAQAQLARDQAQGADAPRVQIDQANLENARKQLAYTRVAAPMSGMAGLHLVDPGNIIHAADAQGIVVINQLQPISVSFKLPEDRLPQVLAHGRDGAGLRVEVWNAGDTAKLATGVLAAVDNQIDPATGTAKLKAVFDNKDGALFPNQFVKVRLLLQ